MTAEELYVRDAFLGALMLTGNIKAAEHAVLDAITTSECGVAMDKLLVTTAKFAIQVHDECPVQAELLSSNLPVELQRLFMLSSLGRKCFVLRILMGLTPEISSKVLKLNRDEVDEALHRALSDLPSLAGGHSALAHTVDTRRKW